MVTVSKEINQLEHSAVKLTLTVPKDDVHSEYNKLITDYSKNIQIPGFRKGKVPREVLERKFGDALKSEALSHIIEHAITTVFEDEEFPKENRPLPYSTPQVEEAPVLNFDSDLVFSVIYDVLPKVILGNWKGISVEIPDVSISDDDVNRELTAIQERNAVVIDKDDSAVAVKNDVVTVDYSELGDDGNIIAGTERKDFVFTLGSGYNLFKFDDDIVGMKKDQTKDIEKTYPENFEYSDLAEKTKKIRVTLTALKEKQLPDLDDEFAQDVGEEYKSLADLKNAIKKRLEKNLEEKLRSTKVNAIMEKIMENTPVDVPESLIDIQIDARLRMFSRQEGVPMETLMAMMKDSETDNIYIQRLRKEAIEMIHTRFIVETIMRNENISASNEEIEEMFKEISEETGEPLEEIKAHYEKDNSKSHLEDAIKDRKTFDLILAENKIVKGKKKSYLEFIETKRIDV